MAARMLLCAAAAVALASAAAGTSVSAPPTSLFDFKGLVDIEGRTVDLEQYRGNVTLVINVASF